MASTNKTTHYELSQYVGTDKPTYLTDYNQDMNKIDTGVYNAQAKADVNGNNIGDLTNLDTTVKLTLVGAINEVNTNTTTNSTNIGNLSNLETTEKTTLVGAINEVNTNTNGNTTNIGTLTNLETINKSNVVSAINEVNNKAGIPVGSITMFAGSIAPSGYLLCDGSAVSRTTYENLFNVIGTTYGSGDESTTFNLPNLKGRVAVCLDSNDSDFDSLGETGGEKTHTLTINEMPSHNHLDTGLGGAEAIAGGGAGWTKFVGTMSPYYVESAGGGQAHNNLQPYLVLNYIIKI